MALFIAVERKRNNIENNIFFFVHAKQNSNVQLYQNNQRLLTGFNRYTACKLICINIYSQFLNNKALKA